MEERTNIANENVSNGNESQEDRDLWLFNRIFMFGIHGLFPDDEGFIKTLFKIYRSKNMNDEIEKLKIERENKKLEEKEKENDQNKLFNNKKLNINK
jgi:hypothetical protein